jgi:hypothetical protein
MLPCQLLSVPAPAPTQAWVAALRHAQPEPRRGLMREAFDLLVPRLVEAEAAESKDK